MSADLQFKRVWKCHHCRAKSTWRNGWNWRLPETPVETLDSFQAFCSLKCQQIADEARRAA